MPETRQHPAGYRFLATEGSQSRKAKRATAIPVRVVRFLKLSAELYLFDLRKLDGSLRENPQIKGISDQVR